CDEQALLGPWTTGNRSAHARQKLWKPWTHGLCEGGEAKYRCSPNVPQKAGCLHEMVGCLDPPWLRHSPGAQKYDPRAADVHGARKYDPRAADGRCGGPETDSERLGRACETAAGDVGNVSRRVAGGCVGNDNLDQKPGRGRGYERRKGRHQAPLGILRGNDRTQHGTVASQYRCHHIMWRMAFAATR